MDKNEFRNFLEQLGEVREAKPKILATMPVDENADGIVRHGDKWVKVSKNENPTLGFEFVKIKPIIKECVLGCGEMVENQLVERKLYEYPDKHWRTSCKNCKCTVGPDGKTFVKGTSNIQNAFYRWYLKRKE